MTELNILRLQPADTSGIVSCFQSVYGDTYANEHFYDAAELSRRMQAGQLYCVGAKDGGGQLLAHMAMSVDTSAQANHGENNAAISVEMGNTVVTPAARGQGVAWQVGAQLQAWAVELGYRGFLHYPTTDHQIMQRQSVNGGFETGLMLGYIPADTDGQVQAKSNAQRNAATIVYQPIGEAPVPLLQVYLPQYQDTLITELCAATGLLREWLQPAAVGVMHSDTAVVHFAKRALTRLRVNRVGEDFSDVITTFDAQNSPCRQIDFVMSDEALEAGLTQARARGYVFCGWLPGLYAMDVLRLQKVAGAQTNLLPDLANEQASRLLTIMQAEMAVGA